MIHFFVSERFLKVIRLFFSSWGRDMSSRVCIWSYEQFSLKHPLPPGVYIFTDLERLLPAELEFASGLADHFAEHPASYRVLNHPRQWANRFALQRRLSEAGINDFRVWRLHEVGPQIRYPVFVRRENDHRRGSGLLHDAQQLEQHVARLSPRDRLQKSKLMVVEFANVAQEDGIFRKYSAMRIDDELIPRHVLFSKNWLIKKPDLVDERTLHEESEFQHSFPHASDLLEVFRLAGIDYGRVDYGIRNGRLQIWEINTNPVIVPPRSKLNPSRVDGQSLSANRILSVFERLADSSPRGFCAVSPDARQRRKWTRAQLFGRIYSLIRQ